MTRTQITLSFEATRACRPVGLSQRTTHKGKYHCPKRIWARIQSAFKVRTSTGHSLQWAWALRTARSSGFLFEGFTAVYGLFLVPSKRIPSIAFQRAMLHGEARQGIGLGLAGLSLGVGAICHGAKAKINMEVCQGKRHQKRHVVSIGHFC